MISPSPASTLKSTGLELAALRPYWPWFLALGIVMALVGTAAVSYSCLATLTVTVTWIFGFILLGSGIAEFVNAFWVGRWSGLLFHALIGVMYALVGLMIIEQPARAAIQITLVIALFLMFSGALRVVFAAVERFPGWGWVIFNGVIAFALGLMIYKQWPLSGAWVIGLFIGIDLILNGWTWIMLAIALSRADKVEQTPAAA